LIESDSNWLLDSVRCGACSILFTTIDVVVEEEFDDEFDPELVVDDEELELEDGDAELTEEELAEGDNDARLLLLLSNEVAAAVDVVVVFNI